MTSTGVPRVPSPHVHTSTRPHVKARLGLPVDNAEAEEVAVVGVGLLAGSPFVNAWSKIIDASGERRGTRE